MLFVHILVPLSNKKFQCCGTQKCQIWFNLVHIKFYFKRSLYLFSSAGIIVYSVFIKVIIIIIIKSEE